MIERYIEITCDACGEIEWSEANVTLREFKAVFIPRWKHRGRKAMCQRCAESGVKWSAAVLYETAGAGDLEGPAKGES